MKPRILMVAPLPPPVHGSAMMTQYVKDSELVNEKFDLDWVNLSTSRKMSEIGKKSPVKVFRFLNSYIKTFWTLLTKRYDCCYLAITCHGKGFLKDAPFVLLCKMFRRKIIIHQHNKGMADDVHKPLYRFLFNAVYKNSKVILLSERLYPDISEIVDHKQVSICPNGIPSVERYNMSESRVPKILFLSNLIESKGVFDLLDACQILKDKGYRFICDFVGGETKEIDRTRFEEEVKRRGLDNKVNYLGPKYGKEKYMVLSCADVFVLPTKNECFPLVLLESMQQGVPSVSSPIGGIPDIIEDGKTGLISEVDNSGELSKKISYLLDNPSMRKKMGEGGYERYIQNFSLKNFEENIAAVFSEVIKD